MSHFLPGSRLQHDFKITPVNIENQQSYLPRHYMLEVANWLWLYVAEEKEKGLRVGFQKVNLLSQVAVSTK